MMNNAAYENHWKLKNSNKAKSEEFHNHLLQIIVHIFQFHFKTFKAHQLIGNFLAQSANRGILDVSQKMLHSNFFGFFRANFGWNMLKCFCCGRTIIVNLFDCLLYKKKRLFFFYFHEKKIISKLISYTM